MRVLATAIAVVTIGVGANAHVASAADPTGLGGGKAPPGTPGHIDPNGVGGGKGDAGADPSIRKISAEASNVSLGAGGSAPVNACAWVLVDGTIADPVPTPAGTWPHVGVDGRVHHLYQKTCPGDPVIHYVDVADRSPQDLVPFAVHDLEERVLPKPVVVIEPLDAKFGWTYVRVPLDFRTDAVSWKPYSVTASAPPALSVTVTATPHRLVFDPGDVKDPRGTQPVWCDGLNAVAGYDPKLPGACSYKYLNSSSISPVDGYHFPASLSIEWSISWVSSTGESGVLPGFATTTPRLLAVAEVQALVSCTGPRPEQGGC